MVSIGRNVIVLFDLRLGLDCRSLYSFLGFPEDRSGGRAIDPKDLQPRALRNYSGDHEPAFLQRLQWCGRMTVRAIPRRGPRQALLL